MATVGRAEVDIVADLSNFGKNLQRDLQRAVDKVKIDSSKLGNDIGSGVQVGVDRAAGALRELPDQARESMDGAERNVRRANKRIKDSFEDAYKSIRNVFSRLGNVLFTFRSRVIGLGAIITIALAGIVAATDELLGLLLPLPALLASVGVVVATFNVAMFGMGDALKAAAEDSEKFEEAIAGLAPAAQSFAREYRSLLPLFQSIRIDVQQAFWEQLEGTFTRVAANLAGPMRRGMVRLSEAMGGVLLQFARFAMQSETGRVLALVFEYTAQAMDNLAAATMPFLQGMRTLVEIFAPQIEIMTSNLERNAIRFRDWAAAVQESGEALERFQQAAEFMNTLGSIVAETFRLIGTATKASHDAGVDLFRTIRDLIQAAADLGETAPAQAGLQEFFVSIDRLVRALLPVLGAAAVQIGRLTTPLSYLVQALAPGVKAAFEGIADALIALVDSGGEVFAQALSDAFIILAPHLGVVGQLVGELLKAVSPLLDPLARLIGFVLELAAGIARLLVPFIEPLTTFLAAVLTPLFTALLAIAEQALPPLAEAFQRVSDRVVPLVEAMGGALLDLVEDTLPTNLTTLETVIDGVVWAIDAWIASQELLLSALKGIWNWIKDNILPILRDELWPVIRDQMIPIFEEAWAAIEDVIAVLDDLFDEIRGLVGLILNDLDPALGDFNGLLMTFRYWLAVALGALVLLTKAVSLFTNYLRAMTASLKTMSGGVKSLRDNYNNLKTAINSAGKALKSIIDRGVRVINTLKNMRTAAQNLTSSINNIPSLPSGLGGIFNFFADGGIVNRATAAIIGEAGPEVVLPLTRPARARELAAESGLLEVLMGGSSARSASQRLGVGGGSGSGGGASVVVEAGAVVIEFRGNMPDEQRARRVGNAAAEGLLNTLAARNVRLAVRSFG